MISYQKVKVHLYPRLVTLVFVSYRHDEGVTTATHTNTGPVRLVRPSTSLSLLRVFKTRPVRLCDADRVEHTPIVGAALPLFCSSPLIGPFS